MARPDLVARRVERETQISSRLPDGQPFGLFLGQGLDLGWGKPGLHQPLGVFRSVKHQSIHVMPQIKANPNLM